MMLFQCFNRESQQSDLFDLLHRPADVYFPRRAHLPHLPRVPSVTYRDEFASASHSKSAMTAPPLVLSIDSTNKIAIACSFVLSSTASTPGARPPQAPSTSEKAAMSKPSPRVSEPKRAPAQPAHWDKPAAAAGGAKFYVSDFARAADRRPRSSTDE